MNSTATVEFEELMSLDVNIKSASTRWERKMHQGADRFIPSRSATDFDVDFENKTKNIENSHAKLVSESLDESKTRVLAFKNKAPVATETQNSMKVLYSAQTTKKASVKPTRHIASAPIRILDAPDMLDDYYLNLLSWSDTNVLAVSLQQSVYLWNSATGGIKELTTLAGEDYVSSVSWIQGGAHLAVGTSGNAVQLWDSDAGKQVRTMGGHNARVGALAWNNHLLASGSKDNTVLLHDVRIQQHVVACMSQHTQEVCGLAWSPDGTYLASGANDNLLCLTEAANFHSMNAAPRHVLTDHQAAVKALAWSPHERNLLASGGGTADRCIKFWNAQSGALVNSVDTGSQVCALQWSPFEKELLSSHGYADNQLTLWKYPTMARVKDLTGHTSRVLHMVTSPDGSMVCTGAADETLRFWNIFGLDQKKKTDAAAFGNMPTLSGAHSLRIR